MHRQIATRAVCTLHCMKSLVRCCLTVLAHAPLAAVAAGNDRKIADAALEASLGAPRNVEVDEVRITGDGVACIEYRVQEAGRQTRGHAVVQGKDVLRSPSGSNDTDRFEKAWREHCLGPHGGITSEQQ